MRVAVQGCLHGELDQVYAQVANIERKVGEKFDLLIICGDFQSIRHQQDLDDMHCPEKYKQMGCFHDYYEGRKKAGLLTVMIGGNHEAVNSLRQSHFGGWLAPNIYYLGQVGSIFVVKGNKRIRITGSSGIYNHSDFKYCTRIERYPLKRKDRITAYHNKQLDMYRMELLARINQMKKQNPAVYGEGDTNFDIVLSHDWPKDIALFGETQELFKVKPYFQKQVEAGTLGSPPMLRFLKTAKPNYWFSAHLHVKYPAIYPHPGNQFTHFLSLDKCLGKRSCLQMLQFDKQQVVEQKQEEKVVDELSIEVDSTWIGVLLLTKGMMRGNQNLYYFDKQEIKLVEINKMNQLIKDYPCLRQTIKSIGPFSFDHRKTQIEQTAEFLAKIGIQAIEVEGICIESQQNYKPIEVVDEIQLDL